MLADFYGSRALRRLVLLGKECPASSEGLASLPAKLWTDVFKGSCKSWISSHAAKVRLPRLCVLFLLPEQWTALLLFMEPFRKVEFRGNVGVGTLS